MLFPTQTGFSSPILNLGWLWRSTETCGHWSEPLSHCYSSFHPAETISGARVLLTGASAGIGEQMAYHYSRFGAEIVLTARREAVLQKVRPPSHGRGQQG